MARAAGTAPIECPRRVAAVCLLAIFGLGQHGGTAIGAMVGTPVGTAVGTVVGTAAPIPQDLADQLSPIVVERTGPRFVAPTRRDSIGRIWAPVYIDGKGPFRLVLDTGATQSALIGTVASILGLPLNQTPPVLLRGVTGVATVPTVRINQLSIGDLDVNGAVLPIVPDALGGADGILGTAGLEDKRIVIDFLHDRITITFSRGKYPHRGFETLHFLPNLATPIIIAVRVGGVRTEAIIDTGGQLTIANDALRDALLRHRFWKHGAPDQIMGATRAVQAGEIIATPAIDFGAISIRDHYITYSNLTIFAHWHLLHQPAILIGMDALGTLDQLIIDYRTHEIQMRVRPG